TALTSPLNGSTDVSIASDLTWTALTNADGYFVTVGTTSGGSDILDNENVTGTTFDLPTDLPENTEIFVTIIPYNGVGNATGCAEESFTTETLAIALAPDNTKYGFSPDGDGVNEYWEIDTIENYPDNTVTIYNRWGDIVFTIKGYNNSTNVFRGEANKKTKMGAGTLPSGTYFFDIQINGNHNLKKTKGFVVLKR
ncbi:gliding motility-associated C-terminal domain-containing protein, partial [Hyunsoonleella sp. 2307UL5-6]|uniref:gliding motility-associated C-terminal domain-containing protein n=1 Tax=Hyunsoonleella sp. 2307UL5-6 TaxID=3384768 RepID=UPI0039BCB051